MTHLIITTANIPAAYLIRRQQYLNSINACLKYSNYFDSYKIIECYSRNEEYLNAYNTYYSEQINSFENKGLNELTHIRAYLNASKLSNDDFIIKLSGRYIIEEDYFLNKVLSNQHLYDSFFKDDSDIYIGKGFHTFFYAIKKGLLSAIIDTIDFSNSNNVPIEWDFEKYLTTTHRNLVVEKLGLTAYQGTHAERIFRC